MRRTHFTAWLAALALSLSLLCAGPALAVPDDGVYTYVLDGAQVLVEDEADLLEARAQEIAEVYGFAPYVVTVETLSGMDADDVALSYYDEYAMGAGDSRGGAILLVNAEDGSYSFQVMNADTPDQASQAAIEEEFLTAFGNEDGSWYEGFAAYLDGCASALSDGSGVRKGGTWAAGDPGGADGEYILDMAGILENDEKSALESRAASIAASYGFAPCVVTVDSLDSYDVDYDVEGLARAYYTEYEMGVGPDNNGALLLMSMEDRDFWFLLEDHDSKVFDEYRYESVQEAFLKEFRDDDWYGGFTEYLNAVEHYLSGAADAVDREAGEDWNYYGDYAPDYGDDSGDGVLGFLIMVGVPVVLALLISLGLLGMMKSVRPAVSAGAYVTGQGLNLRIKEDVYTHTTESRVKVESDHDSSSSSSHGGGGGGSFSGGGKF